MIPSGPLAKSRCQGDDSILSPPEKYYQWMLLIQSQPMQRKYRHDPLSNCQSQLYSVHKIFSAEHRKPTQSPKTAILPMSSTLCKRRFCSLPDSVPRGRIRSTCGEDPEETLVVHWLRFLSERKCTHETMFRGLTYTRRVIEEAVHRCRVSHLDQRACAPSTLAYRP